MDIMKSCERKTKRKRYGILVTLKALKNLLIFRNLVEVMQMLCFAFRFASPKSGHALTKRVKAKD